MIAKLLSEYHSEFLSLKGGCRGSSESTLVKMSNCLKSHATAQLSHLNLTEENMVKCYLSLKAIFKQTQQYSKEVYFFTEPSSTSILYVYKL